MGKINKNIQVQKKKIKGEIKILLPLVKEKFSRIKRRELETTKEPKIKRRKEFMIFCDPLIPICYVCGEEIRKEYITIKKKGTESVIKKGKEMFVKVIRNEYIELPPLMIGKTKGGIRLYRHREKKECQPFSSFYMKRFSPFISKELMSAYKNGLKELAQKRERKMLYDSLPKEEENNEE